MFKMYDKVIYENKECFVVENLSKYSKNHVTIEVPETCIGWSRNESIQQTNYVSRLSDCYLSVLQKDLKKTETIKDYNNYCQNV